MNINKNFINDITPVYINFIIDIIKSSKISKYPHFYILSYYLVVF